MSATTLTPNMNLPVPVVGQEPGPDYAIDINAALTLLDAHDHTAGNGVLITPYAININTSLSFNDQLAINLAGVSFEAQSSTAAVSTIYEKGVDLYYVDGLGNDVRITQDGGIAGTPGSISNLTAPASASYVSGSSTFVWQSDTNIAANMDMGSILLRNLSPNSTFALTLTPPAGLSSNFSITLPTLPVAQSFMTINESGIIQAPALFNAGLVNSNLANETITAAKIAPNTIDGTRMVNHTVGFTQLDQTIFQAQEVTYVIVAASFAVRVATTVNGTLSTAFHNGSVVDGVTLATNDLILLKNQTLASENGVYVVQAAGSPVRSTSYDSVAELNFAGVVVTAGTANTGKSFYQNTYLATLSDLQVWSESQSYKFTVPSTGVNAIQYEMCGGGGGSGGSNSANVAGGGGGGGGALLVSGVISVSANDVLSLTVGAGGNGGSTTAVSASNGDASIIMDENSVVKAVAIGGGGGGRGSANTVDGFPGNSIVSSGGIGGVRGGAGGGGGGGGGASLGPGGDGGSTTTTPTAIPYSGGGGGGGLGGGVSPNVAGAAGASNIYGYTGGAGGNGSGGGGGGGGGAGPYGNGAAGAAGTTGGNTGNAATASTGAGAGGAGGCASSGAGRSGAKGGSGKIIIRYYGS